MRLSTSLKKFKKLHRNKNNQAIYIKQNCKNYRFIENLFKFILSKKK